MSATQKRWLNKQEAAEHLGVSERTLRRLTEPDKGGVRRLPFYKINARTVYKVEDLDAYVESCRFEAA